MIDALSIAKQLIGWIDILINQQLNLILHHNYFQQLESSWRGMQLLVNTASQQKRILIRYYQMNYRELNKDVSQAVEVEQSVLYRKIYTDEFDHPGGRPFGILIGDYEISHLPIAGVRDGIECLRKVAKIGASAFVPFITGVAPAFFGLDSFAEFTTLLNLENHLKAPEYYRWHKLRQDENARFVALILPKMLIRLPYNVNKVKLSNRLFSESVTQHQDYLWCSAIYAYACVIMRSFSETGWFNQIRGGNCLDGIKPIVNLPCGYFNADYVQALPKLATEYLISDQSEKILSDNGFIALRTHRYIEQAVFYSSQTVKIPTRYHSEMSDISAKRNTLLDCILCFCRFAQYIKIIIRDKLGSFATKEECEDFIRQWLNQYTSTAKLQSVEASSKRPLTEAHVSLTAIPSEPGKYYCVIQISPYTQVDNIQAGLKLVTNIRLN
jgi:type VI secretion system protein ImpD